jgi:hypothetical protein
VKARRPLTIPGPDLDARLGLPSAVFRVRRWTQWLQLAQRLRRAACPVVAAEGFDDRVAAKGPILWRDVVAMDARSGQGNIVALTVRVARAEGGVRDHRIPVSELFGDAKPVLAALGAAHERWQARNPAS